MPKYDFNKVALQLYWNHTSAWLVSCIFTAYFQNTFSRAYRKRPVTWNGLTSKHVFMCSKPSNGNTRSICEIYSKLTIKTPESFWCLYCNFERIYTFSGCFHFWIWTSKRRLVSKTSFRSSAFSKRITLEVFSCKFCDIFGSTIFQNTSVSAIIRFLYNSFFIVS